MPPTSDPDQPNIAAELPEEILSFLVRTAPRDALWRWLGEDEQAELRRELTRGFQTTINALRQPVVRARLVHHFQNEKNAFCKVLELWAENAPAALLEIRAFENEDELIAALPELWKRHGLEALLLSLIVEDRETVMEALDGIAEAMAETDEETEVEAPEEIEVEDAPPTAEDLTRLEKERDEWRERASKIDDDLAKAREGEATARARTQAEKRELQRQTKAEAKRAQTAEGDLEDARKQLDRTARRYKSEHKELDELMAENKRMKRQLRRQQELSEELRKQIASLSAKLETAQVKNIEPSAPSTAPPGSTAPRSSTPAPVIVSPLDQPFTWRADGRYFKTTPREVKRAIDRNDEEFVFSVIQAFDTLREIDEKGYRLFLDRLREFDRYYTRVLATDTTRVLVDASNVARYETDDLGRGQLRHLLSMRAELRRRDCFPIVIVADASLPYKIDEPGELQHLVKSGEIQITRSGQEADEILAREARRTGAYVVTNDRTFHAKVSPDFEPLRITFRIYDGMLIVDEF